MLRWGYEGKLRAPSRWVRCSRDSFPDQVNLVPRSAVDGQLMDVHDGMIDPWGGIYYRIGMGHQNCTEAAGILPPQDCPGALLPSVLDACAIS
jgi:hypothetical protein